MRYFITGGAGFVGSHLVDRLSSMGDVTVYDNLSSGSEDFIKHHTGKNSFTFIRADLLDLESLVKAMGNHDIVFHIAANADVRGGITNTRLDLEQNVVATYNVLESMRRNSIRKIVFTSSSTVYGETPPEPIPEDYGPLQPISLYGASKLAGEGFITAFCHSFDMQSWIFRLANVVGPRATHGVIFDFIKKLKASPGELEILGDGSQEKPYIHVEDCVNGILLMLERASDSINYFNIGNSFTSVNDIARMLIEEMGLSGVKIKYSGGDRGWRGDVPQVRFDTSKIEGLGWTARYTSDNAVRRAIKEILGTAD